MTIFEWMKLKGWKVKQIKNKLQLTSSGVRLCRGVSHADPPPLFLPVPPFRKKMLWILIITLSWYKRHVKQWCKCKETSLSSKCNIFIPIRSNRGGKNWISIKIIIYRILIMLLRVTDSEPSALNTNDFFLNQVFHKF